MTKKQNRRTQVRRMRRILNRTIDGPTKLTMHVHKWGYGGGLNREHIRDTSKDDE